MQRVLIVLLFVLAIILLLRLVAIRSMPVFPVNTNCKKVKVRK